MERPHSPILTGLGRQGRYSSYDTDLPIESANLLQNCYRDIISIIILLF